METAAQPTSKYERLQQHIGAAVARNDFNASDDNYFAGNARLVRLRPPLPHEEAASRVQSIIEIGLIPMLVVKRRSPTTAPRPIALGALDVESEQTITKQLATMSDDNILELLRGSQKTIFAAPVRWWPL